MSKTLYHSALESARGKSDNYDRYRCGWHTVLILAASLLVRTAAEDISVNRPPNNPMEHPTHTKQP